MEWSRVARAANKRAVRAVEIARHPFRYPTRLWEAAAKVAPVRVKRADRTADVFYTLATRFTQQHS